MSQGPNVSMGGDAFDFGAANRGPRPGGPGSGGGRRSGGNSGRPPKRSGCATIGGLIILLVIIGFVFRGCGSGGGSAADCGDYDLSNGQYVSNPGQGDYEKTGGGYEYVGCDSSRSGGGGFFFFPFFGGFGGSGSSGSNYGDGSGFRGGGPGTGK